MLREVTLVLPMMPDMEMAAGKAATFVAELMSMSSDKIDEVRMAVVEACINALEHSRAADQKVYVTIAALGSEKPEMLRVTIRDTGVGFEPGAIQEPRIEEKLRAASKRGWGLKIIEGLMDQVDIESDAHGTTIVMSKHR